MSKVFRLLLILVTITIVILNWFLIPTPAQAQPAQGGQVTSAAGQLCGGGILTAIGCVPTEPRELVKALLKFAAGAGGGIAFLLMIAGAFQMIASAGNPEMVKKGSEQLSSAIIGLLFIIFSVLLMQVIGVDILGIPGFKK